MNASTSGSASFISLAIWDRRLQLVGDFAPLQPGCSGVVLRKGGGNEGGDHAPPALACMGEGIAHEVAALMPSWASKTTSLTPRSLRRRDDPRFRNVRQIGTIAALDIATRDAGYMADIGPRLYRNFLARGAGASPRQHGYVMPPYFSTDNELNLVYDAIDEIADQLLEN